MQLPAIFGFVSNLFKPQAITPIPQDNRSFLEQNGSVFILAVVVIIAIIAIKKK